MRNLSEFLSIRLKTFLAGGPVTAGKLRDASFGHMSLWFAILHTFFLKTVAAWQLLVMAWSGMDIFWLFSGTNISGKMKTFQTNFCHSMSLCPQGIHTFGVASGFTKMYLCLKYLQSLESGGPQHSVECPDPTNVSAWRGGFREAISPAPPRKCLPVKYDTTHTPFPWKT